MYKYGKYLYCIDIDHLHANCIIVARRDSIDQNYFQRVRGHLVRFLESTSPIVEKHIQILYALLYGENVWIHFLILVFQT